MSDHCSPAGRNASPALTADDLRLAVVGNPNCGKSTLFNRLTGAKSKVGNYPGVTVARHTGVVTGTNIMLEDLPGTYSLDAISPDEQVVIDSLEDPTHAPDGVVAVIDATALRRGLGLLGQLQQLGLPVLVVLTFNDELTRLNGRLDIEAFARAVGHTVVPVTAGDRRQAAVLTELLADPHSWNAPALPAPLAPERATKWTDSVLTASGWSAPTADRRTRRIDSVLLHPVAGTIIFFAVMFALFQAIFTLAAPLQGLIEEGFAWLIELVRTRLPDTALTGLITDGLIGGVGGVLVFIPQIALLFLMISLMEHTGYMSRAAFLMDRVMGTVGLEGRAFVAMLSGLACAIPGILATRSLPNARDRLAAMMTVPLMTCSARLPVYTMLIAMTVPLPWQGATLFAMYVLGACATMAAAWVFSRVLKAGDRPLPFYMEMPGYQLPRLRDVAHDIQAACMHFLRRIGGVILLLSVIIWIGLNVPGGGIDNSLAAQLGHALAPIFAPLGFDWRITLGLIASMGAREVFVATLGQIAAAANPDDPGMALMAMTWPDGTPLFTAGAVAALLVFFAFALQCVSTIATLRRESGTWRWPAIAFAYMTTLAWIAAFIAKTIVDLVV